VVEQQETFGVRLSATEQSVTLTQDEATVTINDDTGKEVPTVTFKHTKCDILTPCMYKGGYTPNCYVQSHVITDA